LYRAGNERIPRPRAEKSDRHLGAELDDSLLARIRWWAAFKALRNGFWVDDRGDRAMAEATARGFLEVMATMA